MAQKYFIESVSGKVFDIIAAYSDISEENNSILTLYNKNKDVICKFRNWSSFRIDMGAEYYE